MSAMAKACIYSTGQNEFSSKQKLLKFLNMLRTSALLKQHLAVYIAGMLTETSRERQMTLKATLKDIFRICNTLLTVMPTSLTEVLPPLSTADTVVRQLRCTSWLDNDPDMEELFEMVMEKKDKVLNATGKEVEENSLEDPVQEKEPSDNFREMSIFPTAQDLARNIEPFLRKNIVDGQFNDVDHYLDIHFRLMREDFVGPLREGILEYLAVTNTKPGTRQKLKDIRIYNRVHILYPVCSGADGIAYTVQFDTKHLRGIRWQYTKRLIYGSLVCLSPDGFKTVLFATVSRRDPESLAEGQVQLSFCNSMQAASIRPEEGFIMAETSAYFEAYRPILSGLQATEENNMPFVKYLVECKMDSRPPAYLSGEAASDVLDLRPLIESSNSSAGPNLVQDLSSDSEDDTSDQEEVLQLVETLEEAKAVAVFDDFQWPSPETLGMDQSQLEALKHAMQRELAVIQGPPGTGKTYVGLKIIKTLLHNKRLWNPSAATAAGNSPILVICYTNHALDQFLEGIYHFQKNGIVRVGGRSKSKIMEKFLLRTLRSSMREMREVPAAIHSARMGAVAEMDQLRKTIERNSTLIEASVNGLLHEDQLGPVMGGHYEYFLHGPNTKRGNITDWLDLDDANFATTPAEEDDNSILADEDEELPEVEGEAEQEEMDRTIEGIEDVDTRQDSSRRKMLMKSAMETLAVDFNELQMRGGQGDGWERTKADIKRRKKELQKALRVRDAMSDAEVRNVQDPRRLNIRHRWRLYRYWLNIYHANLRVEIENMESQYDQAAKRLQEIRLQEDKEIMQRATILGMTTTGAARYRDVLQEIQPRIVIVEEAAEVLESHIVATLSGGCQHLILIGDHKQLRPNPNMYKLAQKYNLRVSLFERLVINKMPHDTLEFQHRMRPEIANLIHPIYSNLKNHPCVDSYGDVPGVSRNMFFIHHGEEERTDEELKSKVNDHEASYIVALCRYLMLQGYKATQITILTPYTGQLLQMKKQMPKNFFDGVRLSAIDNYQGEENDIILISLVRSNLDDKIGFLSEDNRVCVTLSRAKVGLFMIGNTRVLAHGSHLWSKVVGLMTQDDKVGDYLQLQCQNHPEEIIEATTAEDFDRAPEGGCLRPCSRRLKCGHACILTCHSYDRDHKNYKCRKQCNKPLCPKGHPCKKKCYEDCGRCTMWTKVTMPNCRHEQHIPCYQHVSNHRCSAPCEYRLACGHLCQNKCSEKHTTKCHAQVARTLECGHQVHVVCHQDPSDILCPEKCTTLLRCGHTCSGTCGTCFNGCLHEACIHPCGRLLVCGHQCTYPCTKDCPPCDKPCENRCGHSICQEKCGRPCTSCMEPCAWMCRHHKCGLLCHESCTRPRCNEPCNLELPCGHQCIGICGEACPNKCRVCDTDEVQEIFFGSEEDPGARFVQLEDCQHVFEVEGLDTWMKTTSSADVEQSSIQLKTCPKCRTPIRRNVRYSAEVKKMLNDIELVKKKILGQKHQMEEYHGKLEKVLSDLIKIDPKANEELCKTLDVKKIWTAEKAECSLNTILLFCRITRIQKNIKGNEALSTSPYVGRKINFLMKLIRKMKDWLLKDRSRLSEQEIDEACTEVERLSLMGKAYLHDHLKEERKLQDKIPLVLSSQFSKACQLLERRSPLTEDNIRSVKATMKEMEKIVPLSGLMISEEDRASIVKALGMSRGHWFKCPNGVYTDEWYCMNCNWEAYFIMKVIMIMYRVPYFYPRNMLKTIR